MIRIDIPYRDPVPNLRHIAATKYKLQHSSQAA